MNRSAQRTKVAVLGGGVGGMTAAFELTATPELRDRFDVTVYQLGWRNGGKGASGRNAAVADRIEEHGLHVWFGFYDNAFRLMRDAYEEAGRPRGTPLATFEDAFKGCDELVLYDRQGDGWHPFRFECPRNLLRPGDPGELPTFWEMAATATRWALGGWRSLRERGDDLVPGDAGADLIPNWFENLAGDLARDLLDAPLDVAERLLGLAERLASLRAGSTDHLLARHAAQPLLLVKLLEAFREWLWTAVVARRYKDDPDLRFFFTVVDLGVSTVAGIVKDGILEHGFDVINDEDWAAWLRRHGARDVTIGRTPAERCPALRAVYDVAFAYPGGDIAAADCAAGTATNDLLRLVFSYRGSIMYKMQAGMGDVVFAPLYEVLKQRGVGFEFFHAVTALHPGGNGVDAIDVVRQAELAPRVAEYDPLVPVKGLACWPSEPLWDQLEAAARGVNFEAELNPLDRPARTLERGRDFDEVVLGIPVGALPDLCGELMARDERFRRGIESAVTVRTQAFQLWSNRDAADLGWAFDENSVTGCYVEPLDTYCDMTHLLPRESWLPTDKTQTIGYFCGVLDDRSGETPEQATERAKQNAIEFVERDLAVLWPDAGGSSFDWTALVDRAGGTGAARFDAQYWRANVSPWERYVLTPAGSVEHRLPSNDSGFANLKLAGDWTRTGIDGGCVEAAVISGMDAAQAITGEALRIPGKSTAWLQPQPRELPPYVEYGGRATAPSPFACEGGRLRGLLLRGDAARIAALVETMFNVPAGRGVDYRALGSHVMMLMGDFARVTSLTPPFDRWGAVRETQASFWIPVLAGRDIGDVFVAERLLLAVPYVFVDNPMSYLGGRETFGYAKTMGRFDPASGAGDHATMQAFGGNFGRNEGADWRDFLEVIAGAPRPGAGQAEPTSGPLALVQHLVGDMPELAEGAEMIVGDIRLTAGLMGDLLAGRVAQVFLKQFRDAADGTRACYQAVVEAPVQIRRVESTLAERDWSIRVHPLDSHPIDRELGIADQQSELAFDIEMDFVVEDGHEVGRVAALPGTLPPGLRPAGPNGPGSVIETVARWAWKEITGLERASLGWLRRL
ncbi:MAG: hypothetical protein QOD71_197 [Thermoleophilaceae bacterium]|nr:hypothetical protein [Thermoleophilaceae bacterium]